jgi:hypothetical protein
MYPRLVMPFAILCAVGLLVGCGGGGMVATTSSTSASSKSKSASAASSQSPSQASRSAPLTATPHRRTKDRAQLSKSNQSTTPPSSSSRKHVRTHTTLNKNGAQASGPALPLVKGPRLDVTQKVAACFKSGHAGIVASTMPGSYEIFNTTGPGGAGIEVAATRSTVVAGEVGKAITATGHYVLVPIGTELAVAAVEKGASATDGALAVRCAEVAG